MILSIFSIPSGFSILAIIGILKSACCSINFFKSKMSLLFLTKERAIQSTFCLIANSASIISFVVRAGSDRAVLGRLTPFFDFRLPPCITFASTFDFLSVETISKINLPSSNNTLSPGFTSREKFL